MENINLLKFPILLIENVSEKTDLMPKMLPPILTGDN